jgi:hypothetical protein
MIYLASSDGLTKIIVLETANLERLKEGKPAISPDRTVMIAWTPDPAWLVEKLAETGGDARKIAKLIDEARSRPENPTPGTPMDFFPVDLKFERK